MAEESSMDTHKLNTEVISGENVGKQGRTYPLDIDKEKYMINV
jgi:hypothetical protein